MNRDFYREAIEISNKMEKEGLLKNSQIIRNLIENGSTGTEILMTLHFNLGNIIKERLISNRDLMGRISDLYEAIDKILK
ncbi:hypothetical protein KKF34_01740 [Myxococcota bacterium]|nr:hypothetical protein [Myxococcota bacterium]MBU1381846.1 hypothetical protein [Myxococcota bacterium]MBU1495581.1 hypothetical protein [Myxococcota bacterium]